MKRLFVVFMLSLFLIALVNADETNLGSFQKDTCIQLYQNCDNCTYVNMSSIKYPNATLDIINKAMTQNGKDFNYSFCNTTSVGGYFYNVCGDKNGVLKCEVIGFTITPTGTILSTGESIIYLVMLFILVAVLIVLIYGAISMEWSHQRNSDGIVSSLSNKRIYKIALMTLSYFCLMWIFGILRRTAESFLILSGTEKFFTYLYVIMLSLAMPIMICAIIIGFIVWIQNMKLEKKLARGYEF